MTNKKLMFFHKNADDTSKKLVIGFLFFVETKRVF